ncbi:HNH endonuclease [Pyrococcus furiosus DSM 3638]|uniref:HNH nuclease domain-containing protein n=3 Tax=Pyrococcus furiosus TaxID=2261 RepID=Q8U2D9_PYRFU|nr:hypothetical protein PF0900 [Pyrococcus furiosus DSM 3638]QEK78569.1 HNH endonuclease [Pyrococcus furiosus DSM 3638]
MERDGYKCRICDHSYLDIHYKDGNVENKNLENLIVLCKQCHYRLHQKERMESIKQAFEDFLDELSKNPIEVVIDFSFKKIVESNEEKIRREIIQGFTRPFGVISRIQEKVRDAIMKEIEEEIEKEQASTPEHLRKVVLERNNYRCSVCGYGYLEVHHVDGNILNNTLDNLVTLCRRCHRKVHYHPSFHTTPEDMDKCIRSFHHEFYSTIYEIMKNKKGNIRISIKFDQLGVKGVKISRAQFKRINGLFNHEVINDGIFKQWEREIKNYLSRLEWEQQKEIYRNVYFLLECILPKDSFEAFVNLARKGKFDRRTLREAKKVLKNSIK